MRAKSNKMNNDSAQGHGESFAWWMISDVLWGRSCKGQEQKQKHLNLRMDVGRRNVIVYSSFPEVSQNFSLLPQSGIRSVQRRKWSPNWTVNDPEPQMIPDVNRKWYRRKIMSGMEFGFPDIFNFCIYYVFIN